MGSGCLYAAAACTTERATPHCQLHIFFSAASAVARQSNRMWSSRLQPRAPRPGFQGEKADARHQPVCKKERRNVMMQRMYDVDNMSVSWMPSDLQSMHS
eukprot:1161965-Pelagomonas_calceolata.AAC.10